MDNLKGQGKWLIPCVAILFFILLFTTDGLSWRDMANLWALIFLVGLLVGMIIGAKRLPHG
jgi:hypothetical protein